MPLIARIRHRLREILQPSRHLRQQYQLFKELLRQDQECLELLTRFEELGRGQPLVDWAQVELLATGLSHRVAELINTLQAMAPGRYDHLTVISQRLAHELQRRLALPTGQAAPPFTLSLREAAHQPHLVGGKAWALGRVQAEAGLPTPRGFVITTGAFFLFLDYNKLREPLNQLLATISLTDQAGLTARAQEMASLIRQGQIPPGLMAEVAQRLADCGQQGVTGPWMVRSSAVSEDGELSFAGQYASMANVAANDLWTAYKEVVASKYEARALHYRLRAGLSDQETPMAVLVLEMIDAMVSGVLYTQALTTPAQEEALPMALYATCGHCQQLVDGTVIPEVFYLSRGPRPQLLAGEARGGACLLPTAAVELSAWGWRLEELFGAPQDIEWCQDRRGACFILQSRPLRAPVDQRGNLSLGQPVEPLPLPVIATGGLMASPGRRSGQIVHLAPDTPLDMIPAGTVLVTATLPPALASIMDRLRAVVSVSGSPASHFAAVAREVGLPVICGLIQAFDLLPEGQTVTVDAEAACIYQGAWQEEPPSSAPAPGAPSPFQTRWRRLMPLIVPLHLVDPDTSAFTPENCRSFHDLIRFCHEKGMAAMFALGGERGQNLGRAKLLATELPLTIYVLELEKCISTAGARQRVVEVQQIACPPFQACWQGLTHPDVVWHRGLRYLDWERLDQISAGLTSLKSPSLASYALLAPDFLHLFLRFGYHLAVLGTLCGPRPDANYIAFRFKGGGGDYDNRLRRLAFISAILRWAGFQVQTRGDFLEARLERYPAATILTRLTLWGILQGKCQLLDMALTTDEAVQELVQAFQERYGSLLTRGNPPEQQRQA